jgi:hypothetical protein
MYTKIKIIKIIINIHKGKELLKCGVRKIVCLFNFMNTVNEDSDHIRKPFSSYCHR